MLDWVGDPYQMGIVNGVLDATTNVGANLLCFVGGLLPPVASTGGAHRIFELIGPQNIDGVVLLTSTMMHRVGKDGMQAFCDARLRNIPRCSVGVPLRDMPAVSPNNVKGIKEMVAHLAHGHGHQHVAFVRGPPANAEAEARYGAYVEALKECGLPFDQRHVAVGDFMAASGRSAVRQFSQIPGAGLGGIHAIVASNDSMAMGVFEGLEERGIAVPGAVAVTGFDDIEEADLASSPLTTIRQPLEKLGREAARTVLQWIQTGTVAGDVEISTELVLRRSCGCSRNARNPSFSPKAESHHSFEATLVMRHLRIVDALTRAARGRLGVVGSDWQRKLLSDFVSQVRGEKPNAFGSTIEEWVRKLSASGSELQVCYDVVDTLYQQLGVTLRADPGLGYDADGIFYAARQAINDTERRSMAHEQLRLSRWVRDISYVCNSLAGTFDLSLLRNRIQERLPQVGFVNYFVVAYPKVDEPSEAELLLGREDGSDVGLRNGEVFPASELLPSRLRGVLASGRAFAVLPLVCRDHNVGHILIELDLSCAFSYGAIAEAMATGLYGATLVTKPA